MAIVTFLSDFGLNDHYVAAVKAKLIQEEPDIQVIDICHTIEPHNLGKASFVLRSVFRDFPENTVHIVSVSALAKPGGRYIALLLEGHYFVGADNGLFSLLSDKQPGHIVEIEMGRNNYTTFPAKDIFAETAIALANGGRLEDMGRTIHDYIRLVKPGFRATKKQISGNVIYIDNYGNLITNIAKEAFDIVSKRRPYIISFGREKFDMFHQTNLEVAGGECFVIFNSQGLLEIGINKGNASELLGLRLDSPVHIEFFD